MAGGRDRRQKFGLAQKNGKEWSAAGIEPGNIPEPTGGPMVSEPLSMNALLSQGGPVLGAVATFILCLIRLLARIGG
jgi:hypothetical protein